MVAAAETLLGMKYLFPWQRLVIANIAEAAGAAGLDFDWPQGPALEAALHEAEIEQALQHLNLSDNPKIRMESGLDDTLDDASSEREDAAVLGRQIVILPTGAGKSLCFQLPALLLKKPTLVLFPILSLMADQHRRLAERGFDPVLLRGGQSREEREKIWNCLEGGSARFVIANPEVLLTENVMRRLGSIGFAHMVIDEAHCVSEWGESFRPSYLRIAEIAQAAGAPLTTAFTATASPEVLGKIRRYVFGDLSVHQVIGNPDRPNIDYATKGTLNKDLAVLDLVERVEKPAIVFCSSRARTQKLARLIARELPDTPTRFYHAGLERAEKDTVERWFFPITNGVLTATCAYGLGVDKGDIRTVIHRDCPPNVEAYLQESGRAGRDGKQSRAILLWGPEDKRSLARVEKPADRLRLEKLLAYARGISNCRRETLLALLGAACEYCSGCDVCRGEASGEYREKQALVNFIRRNRRRYKLQEASAILGMQAPRGWSDGDMRNALKLLASEGSLGVSKHIFWKGCLELGETERTRRAPFSLRLEGLLPPRELT